jgi:hypothetical protein
MLRRKSDDDGEDIFQERLKDKLEAFEKSS